MKVILDTDLCEAHGDCVVAAPEVFDLGDDDDVVRVLNATPGEDQRKKVEFAARICPVSAIQVEG